MSRIELWPDICDSEVASSLIISDFCSPSVEPSCSPIDDLISHARSVLPLGRKEVLDKSDSLGRALMLDLVSSAETYFRSLLARLVTVCPVCRKYASSHTLSLEAVDYYGVEKLGFGLVEGVSFATEGELLKTTRKLTGIEWDREKSSVGVAVSQFESLSQLRHAAVHAGGELSPRNNRALGIVRPESRQRLVVRFNELHKAAAIVLNAARAYNRHMFRAVIQHWLAERILKGEWKRDKMRLGRLVSLFRCKQDGIGGKRWNNYFYSNVLPAIKNSHLPKREHR